MIWRRCCAALMLAWAGAGPLALAAPEVAASASESGATRLPPGSNRVYQARLEAFGQDEYARAVKELVRAFEARTGKTVAPGATGRAGLKVYSDSGAGLSTPPALLRALIAELQTRGFARKNLLIVGLSESRLRSCGFLPRLSERGDTFEGVPVAALDSGKFYEPDWYYDSPLPTREESYLSGDDSIVSRALERSQDEVDPGSERRSLLPVPLMFDVDLWINLPACSDHPVVGVNGALVNMTLWNASNTQRFFRSPATGPAAVAEMAVIPELRARMIFTIVSLERYQFIGGPIFNSLYTVSEPLVWLSDNPVMLDALLRERIDRGRRETGFRELTDELRLIPYAEQLGLGSGRTERVQWVEVGPGSEEMSE